MTTIKLKVPDLGQAHLESGRVEHVQTPSS